MPDDPLFASLADEIESTMGPIPFMAESIPERAAVLLNQSGQAILALAYFWRYTTAGGKTHQGRCFNLNSGMQRDALTGRSKVVRDIGTFVLTGSKRLITERGLLGTNLDVLTSEEWPQGRGFRGGFGGGGGFARGAEEEPAAVELVLDLAILEDGLCVGPDENGLFADLNESLDLQQRTAQEAAAALRAGASDGRIFEIVRPLARHSPRTPGRPSHEGFLRMAFGNEAIGRLTNGSTQEVLAWLEREAQPRTLQLHRPS